MPSIHHLLSGGRWEDARSLPGAARVTVTQLTPGGSNSRRTRPRYFEATSAVPIAACPAARRAVSTRNGEQLT